MAWSVLQSAKGSGSSGASQSLAFGSGVTAGNLLIVALRHGGATAIATPTDTLGNTYVLAKTGSAASGPTVSIYAAIANASGANTVSETFGTSTNWGMVLAEIPGAASATFDVSAIQNSSGTTTGSVGPTGATGVAGEIALAFIGVGNVSNTLTAPPSGFTDINGLLTGTIGTFDLAYQTVTASGGTSSATWNWTGSTAYIALIATFKPAGGSAFTSNQSASLSFVGTPTKNTGRPTTAGLSFTGTVRKSTARLLAAALSSIGSVSRSTGRMLAASLSLVGVVAKKTARSLSGALSLAGTTQKGAVALLSGSLSFLGATKRDTTRLLAASSSFSGSLYRATARLLAGLLSVAGNTRSSVARTLTVASLAFLGAVSAIKNGGAQAYTQALSASLSFAGTVQRATARTLPQAALSFIGQSQASLTRLLAASLVSAGQVTRQIGKTAVAVLQGSATLSRSASRLFPATLSATGALTTSRLFQQLLSASLALTGAIGARAIGRTLAAALPLTGQAHRAVSRTLAAAVPLAGATGRAVARLTLASLALSAALARGTARSLGAQLGWVGRLLGPPVNTWPGRITLTLLRLARVTPTAAVTSRVTISAALRARVTIAAEE